MAKVSPGRTAMAAPESGVTIRMYRQGHGDCFLLCFRRSPSNDEPCFVLIDCGMKKGSEIDPAIGTDEVITDIIAATNGRIDLAIVTHEHEDHVSGFPKRLEKDADPDQKEAHQRHPLVKGLQIERLWLAWTEDPEDEDANHFRDMFGDQLLTLALIVAEMEGMGVDDTVSGRVRDLLASETGYDSAAEFFGALGCPAGETPYPTGRGLQTFFAADRPKGYSYKTRLAGLRQHVGERKIEYLDPQGRRSWTLPGVEGVRVYPLGPPRDLSLLRSLNPRHDEAFQLGSPQSNGPGLSLSAALRRRAQAKMPQTPFSPRLHSLEDDVKSCCDDKVWSEIRKFYFGGEAASEMHCAQQRQIGHEWLGDADELALRINNEVNNTSLVLLFALPNSGKTLLFTGDAQRGSWLSWSDLSFDDAEDVRSLLGRCVFYKVGHHGSHNATLKGSADSSYANLEWLARGVYTDEFTAMIPSNKIWAFNKARPWKHPFPEIEKALTSKTKGKVIVTSDDHIAVQPPFDSGQYLESSKAFRKRTKHCQLYIEHWIPDDLNGNRN